MRRHAGMQIIHLISTLASVFNTCLPRANSPKSFKLKPTIPCRVQTLVCGLSTNLSATLHKPRKNYLPTQHELLPGSIATHPFFSRIKTCLHWLRCVLLLSYGHLQLKNLFNYLVAIIASRHMDYVHFCHWTWPNPVATLSGAARKAEHHTSAVAHVPPHLFSPTGSRPRRTL